MWPAFVWTSTKNVWNAQNALWSRAFGLSITRKLIARIVTICYLKLSQSTALEQKRFEVRLLSPAFHNLWLLLVYFTCSWVRFAKASSTIRNRVNGPAPARAWWTNEPVSKSMAVFSCPLSPFGPWRFSSFTLCNNTTAYKTKKVHTTLGNSTRTTGSPHSPLPKLQGEWVQAFGAKIFGIVWVDKR